MSQEIGNFFVGETIPVYAEFREDGVLTDPSTVKIYVTTMGGTNVVTNQGMTSESTGLYYYNLALENAGQYDITIVYTDTLSRKRARIMYLVAVQPLQVIQ